MSKRGVAAAVAALGLAAGPALLPAAPAYAADDEFVEVTPSTVRADDVLGLKASCGDKAANAQAATVRSDAFGEVTVRPQDGVLTAAATVPVDQRAGSYGVRLACRNGRSARATLHVVGDTRPSRGPATGFGGTAGGNSGRTLITGGLAAIVAGAALGLFTLRRRRLRG